MPGSERNAWKCGNFLEVARRSWAFFVHDTMKMNDKDK
jgi:hypothetical protein